MVHDCGYRLRVLLGQHHLSKIIVVRFLEIVEVGLRDSFALLGSGLLDGLSRCKDRREWLLTHAHPRRLHVFFRRKWLESLQANVRQWVLDATRSW